MEAGTGGTPPTQQDADAQIGAALDSLKGSVEDMKSRVDGDLATLKSELEAAQSAGNPVDPAVIIQRITEIQTTVTQIDTAVVETPAPVDTPPADQPPADAVQGDQGATVPPPTGTAEDQGQPLYWFDGDPAGADTSQYANAGVTTSDGTALYTFNGDQPGSAPAGEADGQWHLYTGPVVGASA